MDLKTATSFLKLFGKGEIPHPAYLIFFVTSRCMGRCRHCFYWEHINQEEAVLTPEEVEKVAGSMGPLLQVTFTGGEPFLREDFTDLVKIFYRKNQLYHIGIATSGFHPERAEAGAKEILKMCTGSNLTVGLPVEGPRELNDYIRGVEGFYDRTNETISRLKTLKDANPRLTLLVDITASGFNRGRLLETYHHVRDDLCPDMINVILTRGVPREEGGRDLDPREVETLFTVMEKDARSGRISGYQFFSRLLHAKDIVLHRMALDIYCHGTYHLPCEAGRVAGVLLPEGDVYPCELWEEPMGNVRESGHDLPAVWTSERARRIRREILESRCTCYHQCFLSNTIFWNPAAWPGIMKEWAKVVTKKG
ncbi:MAG: radical SAM protein [bacterium]